MTHQTQIVPKGLFGDFGLDLWSDQGFFSKFLMGGTSKFSVPVESPTGTKSDGGTCEKKQTEAKTAHLMQN